MGLAGLYGSTAAGAARGLALRMDHGSQYLSDHFTNQIKFWGIQPSYAFVAEPCQTNGVAERFNRTLKEQIIHGRIYGGEVFFKSIDGQLVLRVVARPRRDLGEVERLQLAPDRGLVERDGERLPRATAPSPCAVSARRRRPPGPGRPQQPPPVRGGDPR